jgi:hypothetical protein
LYIIAYITKKVYLCSIIKLLEKMRHFTRIGAELENYKKQLFSQGFTYEESNEYMKLVFDRATKKYGKMNFFNIDKDGADSIINDIKIEFNK